MKTGRNEQCPCGSGKKYKNCCLQKDELLKPKSMTHNQFREYIQEQIREEEAQHPERFKEPKPIYGYISTDENKANQFVIDEFGLVCKICNITHINVDEVREFTKKDFRPDDWYLSTELDGITVVDGPFSDKDIAIEYARSLTKVEFFTDKLKS